MSDNESENWKAKYYAEVEALEQKESLWEALEEQMRHALSRLTLAADAADPELNRQLAQLREKLRKGLSFNELSSDLERIYQRIQGLDQLRPPSAQQLLERLLEGLQLPPELAARGKALHKRLAASAPGHSLEGICDELGSLLNEALGSVADGEAPAAAGGGLLGRLFGGAEAGGEQGDGLEQSRALLGRIVTVLMERGADLGSLDARLHRAANAIELEAVAEAIAALCGEATGHGIEEALLQLLERLELPAEQQSRVEALKGELVHGLEGEAIGSMVSSVADLVSEMRARVQREHAEMESFLKQLTQRLQELDKNVQLNLDSQRESLTDGGRLNSAVEEQMQGIADSMEQAEELDALKGSVQRHMETIREHLERFSDTEKDRLQQAEQRVAELTERLHDMEGEARELRANIRKERRAAQVDPLTGIPNRLAYNERLALEQARWARYGSPLCVAVWDVDKFKGVNDTYGHQAGDRVLSVIAKILSKQVRETDFVARFGGEEFVLLLPETDLQSAMLAADKLRETIAGTEFHHRGVRVPVTISCGVAQFHEGDDDEAVFTRADAALYAAKRAGRNRCMAENAD